MSTVEDVIRYLERFAPLSLAEDWDNVGLILGDRSDSVSRVMTCLTVTPESAEEAISEQADLIVSHHPVLFRPVQKITSDDHEGAMLLGLLRSGTAVYSAHTAFDSTAGGINQMIGDRLGLTRLQPIRGSRAESLAKIVVFVPDSDLSAVSDAMFQQGAGRIGEYSECSFRVSGTGTFFGSDATSPAVGSAGHREQVQEHRLEVVCPKSSVSRVVRALTSAHSYEEPAFDVYPLLPTDQAGGAGRIGELSDPIPLEKFADKVKQSLGAGSVQIVGQSSDTIKRVAIGCGSGAEFLKDLNSDSVDAFLTGEATFHRQLEAAARGLAMIMAGHYATERFAVEELAETLGTSFPALEVWPSARERDPIGFSI